MQGKRRWREVGGNGKEKGEEEREGKKVRGSRKVRSKFMKPDHLLALLCPPTSIGFKFPPRF